MLIVDFLLYQHSAVVRSYIPNSKSYVKPIRNLKSLPLFEAVYLFSFSFFFEKSQYLAILDLLDKVCPALYNAQASLLMD